MAGSSSPEVQAGYVAYSKFDADGGHHKSLPWEIKEAIGAGTFSEVYRVVWQNQEAALKYHKPTMKPQVLEREAMILKELSGIRGICNVFGQGELKNAQGEACKFIVMDLLGDSLESIRSRCHRLRITTAAEIGIQGVRLLENLHNKGWIHRDIKPGNLMMGRQSECQTLYLID
eukprot:Selendium_serpulae@DN7891_c0_g1_i1.p1